MGAYPAAGPCFSLGARYLTDNALVAAGIIHKGGCVVGAEPGNADIELITLIANLRAIRDVLAQQRSAWAPGRHLLLEESAGLRSRIATKHAYPAAGCQEKIRLALEIYDGLDGHGSVHALPIGALHDCSRRV
jgi:hypothetical protein